VYFSVDFSRVMFTDIRALSKYDENQGLGNHTEFPYSSEGLRSFYFLSKAAPERDFYSVGVIFLEILVGTKLLINASDFPLLKDLVKAIEKAVQKQTRQLLNYMLFLDKIVSFVGYLEVGDDARRREIDMAIKSVPILAKYDAQLAYHTREAEANWPKMSSRKWRSYKIRTAL